MSRELIKSLVIIFISFILVFPARADNKSEQIDQLMQTYYEYGRFNGAILVTEHGQVIYRKGFGYANMEWNIPNTPETKFRLASISKQFTAMLILQLVAEGKLNLDDKLSEYLPYYRKDTGGKITVYNLLTHTAGIPNYTSLPAFWPAKIRDPLPADSLIVKYCSGDLEFESGTKYNYSNSGYVILGAIIEQVSGGKKYEQVLQEKIFSPLGMSNSGYDHQETILSNRAAGYSRDFFNFRNADYLDMSLPFAAGALYSTVDDMYLWDQALYTDKLLSAYYSDIMFKPYLNNYACGWGVNKIPTGVAGDSTLAVMHSGGINGFNTHIRRLVADRHLIVVLMNAPGANIDEICQKVTAILYDHPYLPPKKSAAETLARMIVESGTETADKFYQKIRTAEGDNYDFSENEFNNLGYQLLGQNKNKEAIRVFKWNMDAHPASANTYDSLAEAYMTAGDKENAIFYYNKALEMLDKDINIAPTFKEQLRTGAKKRLRQLKGEE
jgi:CubicO group peptidase (beta-lactamase class C family)